MSEPQPHACQYRERLVWEDWTDGARLRARVARRIPACDTCGKVRPSRRPRRVAFVEKEARAPEAPAIATSESRRLAAVLSARRRGTPSCRARGVLSALAVHGITASKAEDLIERFLDAGWLRVRWRKAPGRDLLDSVLILDAVSIEDHARPGVRGERSAALALALAQVEPCDHPAAVKARDWLLSDDAGRADPRLVRAVAAVALHANSGETLSERVLSAHALGDSKMLGRVRRALERIVGRLDALGVREGAALVVCGGEGALCLAGGRAIELRELHPYVGLSRDTVLRLAGVKAAGEGVLLVENLAPFEACCRGEVEGAGAATVVWTAGYPGRGVLRLVELAAAAGAPVRVWADLDLDGVRIARVVHRAAPRSVAFWRMSPDDLRAAAARRPLSATAAAALRREINARPDAALVETLRAIIDAGFAAEQEAQLAAGSQTGIRK